MADRPINLNKARKARARAAAKQTASENRASHGRTKSQKRADKLTAERDVGRLDGVKREE